MCSILEKLKRQRQDDHSFKTRPGHIDLTSKTTNKQTTLPTHPNRNRQKAQSEATGVFMVKLTGSNFWSELLSGLQRPVWSVLVTGLLSVWTHGPDFPYCCLPRSGSFGSHLPPCCPEGLSARVYLRCLCLQF